MVHVAGGPLDGATADLWTEHLELRGAVALSTYKDGPMWAPVTGYAWPACRL